MSQASGSPCEDSNPAVTVVVPAYNAAATLGRTLESVLRQTHPSWRLIVVDDGSSDDTLNIARGFERTDSRIRVISQLNSGVAVARNVAIELSDTEFVVFLDADDELMPDYVARIGDFICTHPGYDIYHSNLRVVTARGTDQSFSTRHEVVSLDLEDMLESCQIGPGAVVRRSVLKRLGGFRSGVHCEDYDLWLRALADGARALYTPEVLYVYHQEQVGRRSSDAHSGIRDLIAAVARLLAEGKVPDEFVPKAKEAIARYERMPAELEVQDEMHAQAERFYRRLEGALGGRGANAARTVIDRLKKHAMPLRRRIADRRLSRRHGP